VLLGQIEAEMSVASEPVRRYYQLLRIKADDKTDRMEVSADSIKELVSNGMSLFARYNHMITKPLIFFFL